MPPPAASSGASGCRTTPGRPSPRSTSRTSASNGETAAAQVSRRRWPFRTWLAVRPSPARWPNSSRRASPCRPSSFTSPVFSTTAATLNGNLAPNRTALSFTISGLNIPNGTEVMLRWSDPDHASNDHGLAIDEFSVTPQGVVSTQPTLSINDVTQAEGNSGTTNFTFTVSLDSPAGAGGVTFDIATSDGSAAATSDYVAQSLTCAGDSARQLQLPLYGAGQRRHVAGAQRHLLRHRLEHRRRDTRRRRRASARFRTTTSASRTSTTFKAAATPRPSPASPSRPRGSSPAVKSNGFFIQEAESDYDADPNTSEGVFVFTSAAPPAAAAVGNLVTVQATVSEFIPNADPNSPPTTELTFATVQLTSTGNTLPAPIVLTPANTDPSGPLNQLERFEGMRVQVNSLTTVSPTDGNVSEANATSTSTGTFYGVITGVAAPVPRARGAGAGPASRGCAGRRSAVRRQSRAPSRRDLDAHGQRRTGPDQQRRADERGRPARLPVPHLHDPARTGGAADGDHAEPDRDRRPLGDCRRVHRGVVQHGALLRYRERPGRQRRRADGDGVQQPAEQGVAGDPPRAAVARHHRRRGSREPDDAAGGCRQGQQRRRRRRPARSGLSGVSRRRQRHRRHRQRLPRQDPARDHRRRHPVRQDDDVCRPGRRRRDS